MAKYLGNRPTAVPLTSADIQDGVITAADLGADSVDSSELVDGSVDLSHLSASGTKSSSTYLRGDNTFATAGATLRPNAKPLIINGDMAVSQRATAATTITHAAYNTIDRWSQNFTASTMVFTAERSTTVPSGQGFGYSWKIDCTTAEASLAATSRLMLYTRLEGQDCQLLKFGTASAETITLSFWVRSNKTGTYQVNLWNSTLSGYISSTYAISSGDTWEKKVLTFVGDQNTALANTNASAIQPEFVLVGGGNYTGGTMVANTTTTYPSYVTDTRAANQGVNLADSTSNDFYITGVQMEVGEYTSSTIPPFQHESYGDNLARCLRYYEGIEFLRKTSVCYHGTEGGSYWVCDADIVIKRATPTTTFNISALSGFTITAQGGSYYDTGNIAVTWLTGYPVGTADGLINSSHSTGYINCDAEL